MSKIFLLIFNASMNISFGANLITKPEQFFSPKDTLEEKEHIRLHFALLNYLLKQPEIDKFSHNDTIELKRLPSAKKFNFQARYKSPDIKSTKDFEKIEYLGANSTYSFDFLDLFKQLSYAILYKKGTFSDELPISCNYNELFEMTFGLSFIEFLNKAGLKTDSLPSYYLA